ncbi:hypothetical protein [Rhodoplanes sp. Z2-YC6860]|uniref:hypothetical protein n=1 Tax=Rhodoplanes sp. Z2-YC6860 TaxID=674703 RepID=UPI0012ED55FC|nr:hypothetical protein [Rhodoplanes sp. Z2-YC6860]
MFDVYQHSTLPQFHCLVRQGETLPHEAKAWQWKKVRALTNVWPEAEANIEGDGYHLYKVAATFEDVRRAAHSQSRKQAKNQLPARPQ